MDLSTPTAIMKTLAPPRSIAQARARRDIATMLAPDFDDRTPSPGGARAARNAKDVAGDAMETLLAHLHWLSPEEFARLKRGVDREQAARVPSLFAEAI